MRDLALVPFNTRLLAELISDGLSADAFGDIKSQVQLLALYWQRRVEKHGAGAELCLRNAVARMVSAGILQAPRLDVAQADPIAFDKLLIDNVLVPVGDKKVSFRHHILFDYSASQVFIDPADIAATGELLRRERGLGLMLAPSLSFALQGLWTEEQDSRARFWRAVVHFAGDAASDPIARSVAARSACELPAAAEEMNGLAHLLRTPGPNQETAFRAFSHIVGALAVRLDDRQPIQLTPWCHIAAENSANADSGRLVVADLALPPRRTHRNDRTACASRARRASSFAGCTRSRASVAARGGSDWFRRRYVRKRSLSIASVTAKAFRSRAPAPARSRGHVMASTQGGTDQRIRSGFRGQHLQNDLWPCCRGRCRDIDKP